MITPMKKIYVLAQRKEASCVLESLVNLGIVHIEHQQPPKTQRITQLNDEIGIISKALEYIQLAKKEVLPKQVVLLRQDSLINAQQIISAKESVNSIANDIAQLKEQIKQWQPWGNFNPTSLQDLSTHGFYAGLYEVPLKDISTVIMALH